jgi:hypothetical protein
MAKIPSTLIDPKKLQADMLELITANADKGLNADETAGLLHCREAYAMYPLEYVVEWVLSMQGKLLGQNLVTIRKHDRYFPGEQST